MGQLSSWEFVGDILGRLIDSGFVIQGNFAAPTIGVSDILHYTSEGSEYLIIGSEGLGSLSVYDITDSANVTFSQSIAQSAVSGTATLSDLVQIPDGDAGRLLPLGRNDDNFALYDLDPGAVTLGQVFTDADGLFSRGNVGEAVIRNGSTYVYTTQFGQPGINVFEYEAGSLTQVHDVPDNDWRLLDDVTVMHAARLNDRWMMFTGGGVVSGVNSFYLRSDGSLGGADRATPVSGQGISGVTDLGSAQIDDRAFVVVSAAGSDSLSVFRVGERPFMNLIDVARDTLETRFDNVQALEVFQTEDRAFVLAGGADDGVSLFELTHRGKLVHLETFVDAFDTALRNVSSIEVRVIGDEARAYVGSASESGVTELIIDLSRSGEDLRGGAVRETLVGTAGDDVIWGMGRSDRLEGGAGDDRLIDGRGRDTLIGGEGADIFEFTADGRSDFVLDFDPTEDRIDLSDTSANHFSDIFIGTRVNGVVIKIDDEVIRLRNTEDRILDASDFTADTFIF